MKQNGVMPNKKKAAADGKMRQGERDKKKSYLLKTELIYQRQNCRKRGPPQLSAAHSRSRPGLTERFSDVFAIFPVPDEAGCCEGIEP